MFSSLIDLPNKQAVKLPQQIEKRVIANASAKSGNRAHGGMDSWTNLTNARR
jgi:hypothetical protein